jgi:quinoprotein glucose dehydrogenase
LKLADTRELYLAKDWLIHPDARARHTAQRFIVERWAHYHYGPWSLFDFIQPRVNPQTGQPWEVRDDPNPLSFARPRRDLASLHAISCLGQFARVQPKHRSAVGQELIRFISESKQQEVRAAAAKVLGEIEFVSGYGTLARALDDKSPRVRFFAAISLGKLRRAEAMPWLLNMLADNADKDPYLRHAGVMGLAGIGNADGLLKIADQPSPSARMGILLALRRLKHSGIAHYLRDAEPALVTEAARAIHDELIDPVMPELAKLTSQVGLPDAAIHRGLNANFRLGAAENAEAVAALAAHPRASEAMRVEALEMLAAWAKPSGRDRVLGLWRPLEGRGGAASYQAIAAAAAQKQLAGFFAGPAKVRQAAAKLASTLKLGDAGPMLYKLAVDVKSPQQARIDALAALTQLKDPELDEVIEQTLKDENAEVRAAAQRALAASDPKAAVEVLRKVLESGTRAERQSAYTALGDMKLPAADAILDSSLEQLIAGKVTADVQLDLLLAAEARAKSLRGAFLKKNVDKFNAARPKNDPLAAWRETLEGGDAERGRSVFFDRVDLSCRRCHKIGTSGGNVGPELTTIAKDKTREYLLEAIVLPDKILAQGYQAAIVQTDDGRTHSGIVKSEDDKLLTLQTAEGNFITIPKASIEQRGRGKSPMPEDVIKQLNKSDLRDLVEYLSTLK